jgi:hypothetical protein
MVGMTAHHRLVVLALVLALLGAAGAAAGEKKKGGKGAKAKAVTLVGFVESSQSEEDETQLAEVRLVVEQEDEDGAFAETTYYVTLDAKGTQLGQELNNQEAEVTGTLETKSGKQWLTVKKFASTEEPEEDPDEMGGDFDMEE